MAIILWAFDGDGAHFKLAVEAKRIDLAFLFDPMMAVHTSDVDPLPHQITAVYESLLPRQPLRFVLADDPGAGKTIMAGLYMRELLMRADARRILVVAPGSLVEQRRDELWTKFGLKFRIFSRELEATSPSGNPFADHNQLDREHLRDILDRNALAQESMSAERLFAVKEELEKAEARRLQPYFVRAFFMQAFEALGGAIYPREAQRFEITRVPALIRERDRMITGRNRRQVAPVLKRYDRVCFTKEAVQPADRPGLARAALLHPGHPLMLAMSDLLLEQYGNLLRQSAILVDPADLSEEPQLLFLLIHEISSGDGQVLSKRLQFVRVAPDGATTFASWAAHLDLTPLDPADRALLDDVLDAPWIRAHLEGRALALAATTLVPEHVAEVTARRVAQVDKTLRAVHERLTNEINFWQDRWIKLSDDQAAGKDVRLNLDNARRTVADLEGRLQNRKSELQAMRHIASATPVVSAGHGCC